MRQKGENKCGEARSWLLWATAGRALTANALIFTSTTHSKTIPVAIAEFTGRFTVDFGMIATGGVLAAVPPLLIAFVFQRYIVGGLSAGAIK